MLIFPDLGLQIHRPVLLNCKEDVALLPFTDNGLYTI